jgi:hypothetical protein
MLVEKLGPEPSKEMYQSAPNTQQTAARLDELVLLLEWKYNQASTEALIQSLHDNMFLIVLVHSLAP